MATAAKHVLRGHLEDLVSDLPDEVCLYRPACWSPGPSDEDYSSLMDLNCFEPCGRQVMEPLVHAFHACKGDLGADPKVRVILFCIYTFKSKQT